jgi:putative endonuclease
VARTTEAGSAGESFVVGRLERAGYRVIERNWRIRGGEIDIVALDGEILVFVEVKVRTGERIGYAEDALDARQLSRVLSAAEQYIYRNPVHQERLWRVDFVAITLSRSGVVRRYSHTENVTLD